MDDDVWFPWKYIRYKRKTAHLNHYQDACYRRIIDFYIETRRPPMDSDVALARIVGDSVEGWLANGAAMIRPFFTSRDGLLYNDTCEEILQEQEEFKADRVRSGRKGGNKTWKNKRKLKNRSANSEAIGQPIAKHSTGQDITLQDSKEEPPTPGKPSIFVIDQHFAPVWGSYPGRGKNGQRGEGFKGRRAAGLEVFRDMFIEETKGKNHEDFIGKLVAAAIGYGRFLDATGTPSQSFANWIKSRGWEDDYNVDTAPVARSGSGYSIDAVAALAAADQAGNPEGRSERLAGIGINIPKGDKG